MLTGSEISQVLCLEEQGMCSEQPRLPGALFHLQHPKHWAVPRAVSALLSPGLDPDSPFENSLVLRLDRNVPRMQNFPSVQPVWSVWFVCL